MYDVAKRSAAVVAATGGLLLAGIGCASADSSTLATAGSADRSASTFVADTAGTTEVDAGGVLSGNTVAAPLSIPIDICDVAVLGVSEGAGGCAANGGSASGASATASSAGGVLSGNTVEAPLNLPAGICDVAVLGTAGVHSCASGATPSAGAATASSAAGAATASSAAGGVLSGNTVAAPLSIPISINGLAALGNAFADSGSCSCSAGGTVARGAGVVSTTAGTWYEAPLASSPRVPAHKAAHPSVADASPQAQKAAVQTAELTTGMSSMALHLPMSMPMQRPAASVVHADIAKQVSVPVGESGKLAMTGTSVAKPLCAGGAALISGATLSAFAAKAKD